MFRPRRKPAEPREVPIRDQTIRLGQFLKLAAMVESGSEAKDAVAFGAVTVNDEPETRRGRQLVVGDRVQLGDDVVRVTHGDPDDVHVDW